MKKTIICLVAMICLGLAGIIDLTQAADQNAPTPAVVKPGPGAKVAGPDQGGPYFAPLPDETMLPELQELPVPPRFKQVARQYVGVIKNRTNYEVSVPSRNSAATLIVPARGFIEYVSYEKDFDVTVYRDGKPFYCLKINAHPREYAYMCKNDYDFIAEIVKPEPAANAKYRKMKRAIKKPKPRPEGEQETS
jgi:hypothetical protein